ncbi:MAG: response regulator [Lachnospiraceae bacterium]|nr:response regulator [Lachnospiraceae bacterium]
MNVSIFFYVSIVLCILAIIFGLRAQRKNPGYIVTTALLIMMDIICIRLIACSSVREAGKLFFLYYLIQAWMFVTTFWTIKGMFLKRYFQGFLIAFLINTAISTAELILCFNTPRVLAFEREISFGKLWWVAHDMIGGPPQLISIRAFGLLCSVSSILMMVFFIVCTVGTQRIFRGKYLVLTIFQMIIVAMGIMSSAFHLPVWIMTMVMNLICYLTYYFVFAYSRLKLRDRVIESFADEMSDGLILYDMFDELIHANSLIKTELTAELLEDIKDINKLEELLSHTETVESKEVFPYRYLDKTLYFTVHKKVLGEGRNFVGTVFILHDSTNSILQIRMIEEVNRELEQTTRMKSDFLANMSHELRTPMNAVIGLTQIALKEELSDRARDCLKQISSSGKNLLNIINDILDYSKIEAGKMEIFPDAYEPCSEIYDIANILQSRVGDKDIELFFLVDTNLPHELIGDSMRIRQILINLANNAVKFTDHGYVMITLDCENISDDEVMLTYHICDTGQGIKEMDLQKLFTSFQQVNSKRNRTVEGTGLGLAISKSLCEAMGGEIGVNSEYGKGSDFWFRLPQKISDPTRELVIENASDKFGFCINEKENMTEEFTEELRRLGIENRLIKDVSEYKPTGKQDYLFIEDILWSPKTEWFAEEHPDVKIVVLTRFDSDFKCEKKNVIIMHRPQTTLAMVMVLNGRSIESYNQGDAYNVRQTFEAPGARILVVDDNVVNLSIVEGLMEPLKIESVLVESGTDALRVLRKEHFDLILMDHMMPGMDGIDTTKAIREEIPEVSDVPIVALTANVMEGSKAMFIEAGMVDLISKPIEIRQLYAKLRNWLPKDKIKEVAESEAAKERSEEEVLFACLDCDRAIKGLGSESLFKKIVFEYYKNAPEIRNSIVTAFEKEDWADYAIETHALKSTSRQIGAFDLGDLAEKLEHASKSLDLEKIRELNPVALQVYDKLIEDLSAYFNEETERNDLPMITEGKLFEIFEKLKEACDELDMDGMEKCGEELADYSYPEDRKAGVERVCKAIERMDTEACEEALEEFK